MRRFFKRIFAVAIAVAVSVVCFSVTSNALVVNPEAVINNKSYYKLADAFAAAQDGDVITVYKNVSIDQTITVSKSVTLKSETLNNSGSATVSRDFTSGSLFVVESGVTFSVESIKINGANKSTTAEKGGIVHVKSGGKLVAGENVIFMNSVGNLGGAVYIAPNGSFDLKNAAFSGNNANVGKDVYIDSTGFSTGDIDLNGKVDVVDIIRMKKYISDGHLYVGSADFNNDTVINADDLVGMRKCY